MSEHRDLVAALRNTMVGEAHEAADAIEALVAERDGLRADNAVLRNGIANVRCILVALTASPQPAPKEPTHGTD